MPGSRKREEAELSGRPRSERASLVGLVWVWAAVLGLHLLLRLPDIGLWIGFPLLFLPWVLLGPSNWFDR